MMPPAFGCALHSGFARQWQVVVETTRLPLVSGLVVPAHIETDRVRTELVRWPGHDDEVLDAAQLAEIVLLCLRIFDVLGFDTDLEWVWDGQGLALLQARAMPTPL